MLKVFALILVATAGFAAAPIHLSSPKGTTSLASGGCVKTATLQGESAYMLLWKYYGGGRNLARDCNDGKDIEWIARQPRGYVFCIAERRD